MAKKWHLENIKNITCITPTICKLIKINPPFCSSGDIVQSLVEKMEAEGISQIRKCLFYAPDAIGTHFYKKHSNLFAELIQYAPIEVNLHSVFPPKTPVCFASMFSGAMPDVHGIREYRKPVLECDTIFDSLVRSDKKVAIAAVVNSSIACIFRNRNIDYFSEIYDEQVTNRTIQLIEANEHDFIVVYHQEYDDALHKSTPESETAMKAVKNHIESFVKMAKHCESAWGQYDRLITFAPDHGTHINPDTGKGTHGEDIPEDMEVTHFYGIYHSRQKP
jgi:hypothetical protein